MHACGNRRHANFPQCSRRLRGLQHGRRRLDDRVQRAATTRCIQRCIPITESACIAAFVVGGGCRYVPSLLNVATAYGHSLDIQVKVVTPPSSLRRQTMASDHNFHVTHLPPPTALLSEFPRPVVPDRTLAQRRPHLPAGDHRRPRSHSCSV